MNRRDPASADRIGCTDDVVPARSSRNLTSASGASPLIQRRSWLVPNSGWVVPHGEDPGPPAVTNILVAEPASVAAKVVMVAMCAIWLRTGRRIYLLDSRASAWAWPHHPR